MTTAVRACCLRAKKLSFWAADVSSCERVYSLPLWKPPFVAMALAERTCCSPSRHRLSCLEPGKDLLSYGKLTPFATPQHMLRVPVLVRCSRRL